MFRPLCLVALAAAALALVAPAANAQVIVVSRPVIVARPIVVVQPVPVIRTYPVIVSEPVYSPAVVSTTTYVRVRHHPFRRVVIYP